MRENLIDRMIRIYGFEHPIVIQFAELCERMEDTEANNNALMMLVEAHEENPVFLRNWGLTGRRKCSIINTESEGINNG